MRENRQSGSEGGVALPTPPLPLSATALSCARLIVPSPILLRFHPRNFPPPFPSLAQYMAVIANKAVFLDRDGTLIQEKDYLSRPEDVVILPGVGAALNRLLQAGFRLFIVSNQSGVGRGYFSLNDVERVNQRLLDELARQKVTFEKIYIAPEAPGTPSRGRKPSPQFLFDARDEFGVSLHESFMIGDKLIDLECGWNAGVKKSILVRTGYGAESEKNSPGKLGNAVVVDNLAAAADFILGSSE
jgi:D-glycero-D-manno-heptose 1,7-bisphosphate phosphatase